MHQRLTNEPEMVLRMQTNREPRETIEIKISASYENLEILAGCVDSMLQTVNNLQDREQLSYRIRLAAHEVCTNIIDHAYAGLDGQIRLAFSIVDNPQRMVIDLWDDGTPFDPSTVAMPDLSKARTSGYGLFLVHQLMDDVIYESLPDHNHWRLIKILL